MSYLQLITTLTSISLHLQCTGGDIIQKGSHYNFKNNSCVKKKTIRDAFFQNQVWKKVSK